MAKMALCCFLAVLTFAQGRFAEAAVGRHYDRILTIVLENTNYKDAIRDPYLKSLAKRGALLKNYHGVFHPSYPNYLGLIGGNYFWTWFDRQRTIKARTIVDLLEEKGLTWKAYAEGYPGGCFLGSSKGSYVRKHVPFLSIKNIQRNPRRCALVVNGDEFAIDWASGQLPNYAFYTPNNDNNGHDSDLKTSSAWLKKFLEPLLADEERMAGTLIFVTFDESRSYFFQGNHIYSLALGPMVKTGFVSPIRHNHYDHLRMVEDNFSLDSLDVGDDFAESFEEIFQQ